MLLQFKVNNFRSIKDTVVFSTNSGKDKPVANSVENRGYHLLRSAVIYGANASGKSTVLNAMAFMREMVLNSFKVTQSVDKLPHFPFLLSTETETASSHFEIIFLKDDCKYRYGFEMDNEKVYAEWLYADTTVRESRLFERDVSNDLFYVNTTKFKEGRRAKVADNQLFIWRCDQEGGEVSQTILSWFHNLNLLNGLQNQPYLNFALEQMKNPEIKAKLLSSLKKADLSIDDLEIDEQDISVEQVKKLPLPAEIIEKFINSDSPLTSTEIQTSHKKYDIDNNAVGMASFSLNNDESQGTQKFLALSAPILDTLKTGKVLLIDEIDASLHPMLTEGLIKLFHNPETNPLNAQLIFTTHDTNLLSRPQLFGRDQIWFTEKDPYGSTELYSLLEFRKNSTGKDVRSTDNLEKHYLQGLFGAVPYLGEF